MLHSAAAARATWGTQDAAGVASERSEIVVKPCLNQSTIMQCSTEEFIKVSANAGFEWVELRIPKVEEYLSYNPARELRQLMKSRGVKVATLNALEFFSLVPEENYAFMRNKAEEAAILCDLLECGMFIAVPSRKSHIYDDDELVVETTARRLEILSGVADKYGVKLLFEFIGFPDFSVRDMGAALRIVEMVKGYDIKLVIDTFHFFVGGTGLDSLAKVPANRIGIVHINDIPDLPYDKLTDAMRLLPGDGRAGLEPFCEVLKKAGFDGWLSLELFNEDLWKLNPQEVAAMAWRSLQRFAPSFQ
ncbi:MAG TPA: sugar phosphate isomerase/epimerase [Firmicutes bacterium]|nr:sugar phosphate isomerase/epimerase [Bacillota bacterium]